MGCCGGDMSGVGGWFRRLGIYGWLLIGILIVVAAYFIIEHQAHLAAYSTIIFLVIFFGLHMVMCGMGHKHGEEQAGKGAGPETGSRDEKDREKGGGCH